MKNQNRTSTNYPKNVHIKDRYLFIRHVRSTIEKRTGLTLKELKKKYPEDKLLRVGLFHFTTTKKVISEALRIPVEACCWYKRQLEKSGNLVESDQPIICPFTKHPAHLLSTNPKEFARLRESTSNQLKMF